MAYKYLNDEGLKALVKKIKSYVSGLLPTQRVTWAELKALRDGGKLTAGRKYRITDFVTTSVQAETRSAGHAFDVIVTADDEKTLNENAHAAIHSGDTYFGDCKLNAWELKYSLDNDVERFAWADATNGKGVVWWMRDEWDNECFYDFKNIQYKRYKVTSTQDNTAYFEGRFVGYEGEMKGVEIGNTDLFVWAYTFSHKSNWSAIEGEIKDISLTPFAFDLGTYSEKGGVTGNIINPTHTFFKVDDAAETKVASLNNIVVEEDFGHRYRPTGGIFIDNECSNITIGAGCSGIRIGYDCINILCGNECSSWTCGNSCSSWTCGNDCYSWSCGNDCDYWTCGNDCDYWTCGNNCYSWTCGNDCYSWSCGNNCYSWSCGNYCYSWSCGNYCSSWTCGNDCSSWTCGNYCSSWSCGNYCYYWSCGNNCSYWSCGNYCSSWSCGNYCYSWTCGNKVSGTEVLQDFVSYFRLESGVNNITIKSSGTPTGSKPLKNFVVKAGVKGATSTLAIVIDAASFPLGSDYEWIIAKNSKGEIKQYCEADLIN